MEHKCCEEKEFLVEIYQLATTGVKSLPISMCMELMIIHEKVEKRILDHDCDQ